MGKKNHSNKRSIEEAPERDEETPLKYAKQSSGDAQPTALVYDETSHAAVTDFPRGGANVLTPLEMRTIRKEAERDFVFESANKQASSLFSPASSSSSSRIASSSSSSKKRKSASKSSSSKKEKQADSNTIRMLNFNNLTVGMNFLGTVSQIKEFEVMVSLPNNLIGSLSLTEISNALSLQVEREVSKLDQDDQDDSDSDSDSDDEEKDNQDSLADLDQLFHVGQYIACSIVSLERTERGKLIELTTKPSVINQHIPQLHQDMLMWAAVHSVQEKGYLLDFGLDSLPKGFLKFPKKSKKSSQTQPTLAIGQTMFVVPTESPSKSARLVQVDINQSAISKALVTNTMAEDLDLDSIKPGMLVKAKVTEVKENGLAVSFLKSLFHGTVDWFQLPTQDDISDIDLEKFKSKKLKARVIHVNHHKKTIGLSFKSFIVDMQSSPAFPKSLEIGTILQEATVARIDEGVGLLLTAPFNTDTDMDIDSDDDDDSSSSSSSLTLFAHISNVADKHIAKLNKHFKIGQTLPARVLHFNQFEHIVNVTTQPSIINEPYLRFSDVKVGQDVEATVLQVEKWGMLVSIGKKIRAICPAMHLADVPLRNPTKKFRPSQKLQFRVWHVDAKNKKITLTRKKTLLNSELPIIKDYRDPKPNDIVHGVITDIKDTSIAITFYGNVYGTVPSSHLSRDENPNPSSLFSFGHAVKCRVLSCNAKNRKLKLSMLTLQKDIKATQDALDAKASSSSSSSSSQNTNNTAQSIKAVNLGDVLSATTVAKTSTGILVKLDVDNTDVFALLPQAHMSDHPSLCKNRFEVSDITEIGHSIDQVLVLRINKSRNQITVSAKNSLITAAQNNDLPSDIKQIRKSQIIPGYVRSVTDFGCFIGFLGECSGLAYKDNLADVFVGTPSKVFTPGQSVTVFVETLDKSENQMNLVLKASVLNTSNDAVQNAVDTLADFITERDSITQHDLPYSIGAIVDLSVASLESYGVLLSDQDQQDNDADDITFLAIKSNADMDSLDVGDDIQARILDIDPVLRVVDVCLLDDVVQANPSSDKAVNKLYSKTMPKAMKKAGKKSKSADNIDATIRLVKDDYAVVTADIQDNLVVATVATKSLNSKKMTFKALQVGNPLKVTMQQMVANQPIFSTDLTSLTKNTASRSTSTTSSSSSNDEEPEVGDVLTLKVVDVLDNQVTCGSGGTYGRIHITEIQDDDDTTQFPMKPLKPGSEVTVRALGKQTQRSSMWEYTMRPSLLKSDDAVNVQQLPDRLMDIDQVQVGQRLIGFVQKIDNNGVWLNTSVTMRCRIFLMDLSTDIDVIQHPKLHFKVGSRVSCAVTNVDPIRSAVDVVPVTDAPSSKKSKKSKKGKAKLDIPQDPIQIGALVPCRILGVSTNNLSVSVQLPRQKLGKIFVTDVNDKFDTSAKRMCSKLRKGAIVMGRIIAMDDKSGKPMISLRASAIENDDIQDSDAIESVSDVQEGDLVQAIIKSVTEKGCFLFLGRDLIARSLVSNLSDKYIRDLKAVFKPGKVVQARVISIDKKKKRVEVSLKQSVVNPKKAKAGAKKLSDFNVDDIVKGYVKTVNKYGVFVRIKHTDISGLAHLSQLSDAFVQDPGTLFAPGDLVKAKIIDIDTDAKKISFSLKPSNFPDSADQDDSDAESSDEEDDFQQLQPSSKSGKILMSRADSDDKDDDDISQFMQLDDQDDSDDDDEDDSDDSDDSDDAQESDDESDGNNDGMDLQDFIFGGPDNNDSDNDSDDFDDESDDDQMELLGASKLRGKKVSTGFEWDGFDDDNSGSRGSSSGKRQNLAKKVSTGVFNSDSDSDDSDDESQSSNDNDNGMQIDEEDIDDEESMTADGKKTRKQRMAEKRKREEALQLREEAMADDKLLPESIDDYDKLVMASPNSSYVWLQYMSYMISIAEIEKARSVGDRALKTIDIREPREKFNIWVALMNLENTYGTHASLMKVFEKALLYNDRKEIYFQLIKIFQTAENDEMVRQFFTTMTRKFRESSQVWVAFGRYLLEQSDVEAARDILHRSLKSLPRRKHLQTCIKFAQLEYKYGEPERGRTLFEEVLSNYPKRNDFWNIYLDMEMSVGDIDIIRKIFERAISLNLSSKKMRTFFKRYVDFEKKHGDDASVQHVVEMANEYLESKGD